MVELQRSAKRRGCFDKLQPRCRNTHNRGIIFWPSSVFRLWKSKGRAQMGDEIVLKSPFNFDVAVVRPDFQSHLGLLVRAEATCDIFNPILKIARTDGHHMRAQSRGEI